MSTTDSPESTENISEETTKAAPPQENPIANIALNVLLPVLALSHLSKDPKFQPEEKFYHLGPMVGMLIALALPLGYGAWFLIKHRKLNFFSGLGIISVLLTGGLTLFLWKEDGSVDSSAPILFGLKEASIPFVLGVAILASHWTKTPLLNTFLYNDSIFDIKKIENVVDKKDQRASYRKLLLNCSIIFAASFLVSTVLNFFLAKFFLSPDKVDYNAENARDLYNGAVGKITGWGFLVIGLPAMVFMISCFFYLIRGLRSLTGLENEEITLPR